MLMSENVGRDFLPDTKAVYSSFNKRHSVAISNNINEFDQESLY